MISFLRAMPKDFSQVFKRFPVPVAVMAVFTGCAVVSDVGARYDWMTDVLFGLVIAAYAMVCWVLSREALNRFANPLLQIAMAIVICVFVWFADESYFNRWMLVAAILLFLGNAAYWRRPIDNPGVWDFTHLLWTAALFTVVGSIIYFIGVKAIVAAMDALFGVDIQELTNRILLPLGFGFLAPLYWLSSLPQQTRVYENSQPGAQVATTTRPSVNKQSNEPAVLQTDIDFSTDNNEHENLHFVSRAIGFIGTWLLAPMMLIYTLILLAYGIKIVLAGELPDNEVAELTYPFLIIGTFTWLVLEAPFVQNRMLARFYRQSWFLVVLPVAGLLAVVTWIRIIEFGFTPQRIALGFCVIWSLVLGVYFGLFRFVRHDIRFIPGVAAVLLLVAAFTAEQVSYASQLSRAKESLVTAGFISAEGNHLWQQDTFAIGSIADARAAKGAISYLWRADAIKTQTELFAGIEFMRRSDKEGSDLNDVFAALKLDEIEDRVRQNNSYITYGYAKTSNTVTITDFDQIHGRIDLISGFVKISDVNLKGTLQLSIKEGTLILLENGVEVASMNLREWAGEQQVVNSVIKLESPLVELLNTPDRKVSLLLQSLRISRLPQNDDFHLSADVLTFGF